jgi:K+-sensing histidine kinase KdpD
MLWLHNPSKLIGSLAEVCACVGLSTLAAAGLAEIDINGQFQVFLPTIVFCCWLHGFRGAVASSLLSALVLWYFFVPPPGFALPSLADTGHLFIFLGVAIFVCRIIDRERRANAALMQENFELGYKVFLLREIRAVREPAGR